jgi:protein-tyrosine phosphatase
MHGFVDAHSHMIPSGDDGVRSAGEGVGLVLAAGERGTAVIYGTPHAITRYPVTESRRRDVARALAEMRAGLAGRVDLRLGWEIAPEEWFLAADPAELRMQGLAACLLELPLPHTHPRSLDLFVRCAEHVEAAGLTPIVAHPERCRLVVDDPAKVAGFRERGWIVQVNASSLLGEHGGAAHESGWRMVAGGQCDLVASDSHRADRPPFLDVAFGAVARRIGAARAVPMFTGAALGRVSLEEPGRGLVPAGPGPAPAVPGR